MIWSECCALPKFIALRKQAETDYLVYDFSDVCEKNHERVRKLHHRPKKSQKWKQLYEPISVIRENIYAEKDNIIIAGLFPAA